MKKTDRRAAAEKYRPPNRIREMRTRAGLTQQQLADQSGVNRVTIAKLERQQFKASKKTVSLLSEVLGCEPDVLSGSKKESQWTNAEVKLPDTMDYYLCAMTVPCGRSKIRSYAVLWFNKGSNEWFETKTDGSLTVVNVTPSAWIPIPDDPW